MAKKSTQPECSLEWALNILMEYDEENSSHFELKKSHSKYISVFEVFRCKRLSMFLGRVSVQNYAKLA
ncbi:hypothetical protein T02_5324 [Trichinella nativa]|uniref:Uncharacterized protein n=1 Tax=Trichinella nativa TaxID=6335 RepID=A0A0V1LU03_9BILA|nr:hypothetical protein T02_5324 [Trichinella nativa]